MKRTGKLNISIKPDLKEGVKELFIGTPLSQAFEEMVVSYLKTEIKVVKAKQLGMHDALFTHSEGEDKSLTVENALKSEIDRYTEELERLYGIADIIGVAV